jgi:demethoxyubiquinone hydroxylase (CLK1/Coq7/Cat5 family)
MLTGEKTLKGIITHYSNNRPQHYDDRLDEIEEQIADLESKDVSVCKEFRLEQMSSVNAALHEVYKKIFVGTIKPTTFKGRESRISRVSRADTIKSCQKRH